MIRNRRIQPLLTQNCRLFLQLEMNGLKKVMATMLISKKNCNILMLQVQSSQRQHSKKVRKRSSKLYSWSLGTTDNGERTQKPSRLEDNSHQLWPTTKSSGKGQQWPWKRTKVKWLEFQLSTNIYKIEFMHYLAHNKYSNCLEKRMTCGVRRIPGLDDV